MEDKQKQLWDLLIAMIILPTVVILVRFWSRALLPTLSVSKLPMRFWWDDWTALAAALLNIAVCGIGLKLVQLGMGKHIQTVDPSNIEPFLKLLWVEYFLFDAGTAIAKSSALFFYARIFSNANVWFKYALWIVHALNVAWLVGILLGVIFECNPIEKAWKTSLPGTCVNTQILWMGSGITSLLIDVIILIMPLPVLWGLRMKLVRKLQVVVVFICGYLVVVVSIGRLITIVEAGTSLQLNPTYKIATPVMWLGSEIAISVTSVSLPSLLFLAQRAYREGMRSLITTRPHRSTSRLMDSYGSANKDTSRDDADSERQGHSLEYVKKISGASDSNFRVTAIRNDSNADKATDAINSGIHVRNEFSIS